MMQAFILKITVSVLLACRAPIAKSKASSTLKKEARISQSLRSFHACKRDDIVLFFSNVEPGPECLDSPKEPSELW